MTKKVLRVIKNILVWLIAIVAVCMMIFTVISVATFDRNDRDVFGYKAFIVLSNSMEATDFAAGDVVLSKEVDPAGLVEGDIISFISQNDDNYGEVVTHKIRSLTQDAEGNPGFITYGTTTDKNDDSIVTYPYILGQYHTRLPKVGYVFQFVKSTPGYICCILVPFLLLIGLQAFKSIRLFRKYKREQLAELTAEREKLEAERLESQRLMLELQQLKREMTVDSEKPAAADAPPEPTETDNN